MFNDDVLNLSFEKHYIRVIDGKDFDYSNESQYSDLKDCDDDNFNELEQHINVDDFCSDYSKLIPNIPEEKIIENLSTNEITNNLFKKTEPEKKIKEEKRGRKKKEESQDVISRPDNLIIEFKTNFFQIYLIGICNNLIEKYSPNETKRFKKVKHKIISNLNVKPNLKLFNSTLKYFLSFDISDKYKNYDKENNKNLLKKYQDYNIYFKVLFETIIDDLYKIFINDNCVNINKELFTIESNLSLNYFLNKINNIERKEVSEENWKDIYSFFNDKKKIKSQKEDFY